MKRVLPTGITMEKEPLAVLTLFAFVLFDSYCYSIRRVKPEQVAGKNVQVRIVIKNSGECLEFPREAPAMVTHDKIVAPRSFVIPLSEVRELWIKKFDVVKTALLVVGVVGAAGVLYLMTIVSLLAAIVAEASG